VFISRLKNLPVLDVAGDQLGRVRDVIVQRRADGRPPRVKGLLVELFARHRIFISMARVRNVDPTQVVISGVVNTRRFERREAEILVIDDLFDQAAERIDRQTPAVVFDVAMQTTRVHEWELSEVAIREARPRAFGRRGHVTILDWDEVRISGFDDTFQGTEHLLAELEDMKPADVARELHNMSSERRAEVANALDDEKLANALEELPEEEQVQLIQGLDPERAADVLEEMDPDDAADLIGELAPEVAERLLNRMKPEEAKDVRRLLIYEDFTAGGMMTPEPIILAPDATVAEALAKVRDAELTPALACMVYVCRSPLETPTGKYLGMAHIQHMLREPPHQSIGSLIDSEVQPLPTHSRLEEVARHLAAYNLVSVPVTDEVGRLVGVVTVDDVLDHLLPDHWRENDDDLHDRDSAHGH